MSPILTGRSIGFDMTIWEHITIKALERLKIDECAGVAKVAMHSPRKRENAVSITAASSNFEQISRCCE